MLVERSQHRRRPGRRRQPQARQGQEHRVDPRHRRPDHGHGPRHAAPGARALLLDAHPRIAMGAAPPGLGPDHPHRPRHDRRLARQHHGLSRGLPSKCAPRPHRHAVRRTRSHGAHRQTSVHRPERLRPGCGGNHGCRRSGRPDQWPAPAALRRRYERRRGRAGLREHRWQRGWWRRLSGVRGALIKRTSNVSISSGVQTTLNWQSAVYDSDGFANVGALPTRLTVPVGKGIT